MFGDPAGEAINLFADVVQRLPTVVDADVADGTNIGRGVQLWHFALIVLSQQRLIAWAAVGVYDYEELYGWVVRDAGLRCQRKLTHVSAGASGSDLTYAS